MNWTYATADRTVVYRVNNNGLVESCSADSPVIQQYLADGGTIDPYVPLPPPVPPTIANRQAYTKLTKDGLISQSDAKKAMRGTLPQSITDYITALPVAEQFDAEMRLVAIALPRTDKYVIGMLQHVGVTNIDQFFIAAEKL